MLKFSQVCNCFFLCSVVLVPFEGLYLSLGCFFSPSTSVNISSMISSSQSYSSCPPPHWHTNYPHGSNILVSIFPIKLYKEIFSFNIINFTLLTLHLGYVSLLSLGITPWFYAIIFPFISPCYLLALWFMLFSRILASRWWCCNRFVSPGLHMIRSLV